jgi:hypothetical protein
VKGHSVLETGSLFLLGRQCGDAAAQLGLLDKAGLNYWVGRCHLVFHLKIKTDQVSKTVWPFAVLDDGHSAYSVIIIVMIHNNYGPLAMSM